MLLLRSYTFTFLLTGSFTEDDIPVPEAASNSISGIITKPSKDDAVEQFYSRFGTSAARELPFFHN